MVHVPFNPAMLATLKDKVVVLTGGATGIGRAAVLQFAGMSLQLSLFFLRFIDSSCGYVLHLPTRNHKLERRCTSVCVNVSSDICKPTFSHSQHNTPPSVLTNPKIPTSPPT